MLEKTTQRAADWLPNLDEWPEPEDLGPQLPPVMPFTETLLPDAFRGLVRDTAARMSVPLDYPGIVAVLCLAGVVNRRAVIEPMAADVSWLVTPNLWGALIAPPGQMKSPLIAAITAPIAKIEDELKEQHAEEMRTYSLAAEEYEIEMQAWREMLKAYKKKPTGPAPTRPDGAPAKPSPRRIIVQDSTVEKLHEILADNPLGVLMNLDEIAGWLASFERPGWESARAFFLQAWNGNDRFTVDRIGRGSTTASICVSVLGGIQPARLRSYLMDAVRDGAGNDGLMQRFQLMIWPDLTPWNGVDRPPDRGAAERVERCFRNLLKIGAKQEQPLRFKFDPEAQGLFDDWREGLEKKVRDTDDHPALISHLAKYRSLMPSLALLFELADRSSASRSFSVSQSHAEQAASFCAYLESHAQRIYSCITSPQVSAARDLGERIKQGKLGSEFTSRDLHRRGWRGLDTPKQAQAAIDLLIEFEWLRESRNDSGGRPSVSYLVNPKIAQARLE